MNLAAVVNTRYVNAKMNLFRKKRFYFLRFSNFLVLKTKTNKN